MSHLSQREFVRVCSVQFPEYFSGTSVLEIGSGDINGSCRTFFPAKRYVGVDVDSGPGVDIVGSGHEVVAGLGSFDVAVSCECLEHNPYWRETLLNMVEHIRPGGMIIITCAGRGRPEHGTPRSQPNFSLATRLSWTYYRNIAKGELARAIEAAHHKVAFRVFYRRSEADLYLVGFREAAPAEVLRRLDAFAPQWKTDKTLAMRIYLSASALLEEYLFVTPYTIHRGLESLRRLQAMLRFSVLP